MQLLSPFCPSCRKDLARNGDSFTCSQCGRVYPLKAGIVDFMTSLPLAESHKTIQRTFDATAASYDNAVVRLVESLTCPWSSYTARLESFISAAGGKVILDVGCGTSFPVASFVPSTSIYLGFDVSLEMLTHARALFGDNLNAALWNVDAERIPLPDNCVDISLALMVLNVLPNPHKAATEIHRVLKKDGVVFGTTYVKQPPEEFPSERPTDEQTVREVLAVFDPALWDVRLETEGGILFFHVQKSEKR